MKSLLPTLLLLSVAVSAGAGADAAAAPRGVDLVLLNGHVLTVDARDSVAQALAVRDGRVFAVGSNRSIRALIGPGTIVIDLRGRTATPGLIDAHAHISSGGLAAVTSVDLGGARSIGEVVALLAARAKTLAPGAWLLGSGWDEGKLAEHRYVEAQDLDAAAPANPVWIDHTTGHYGTANSRALALAGITAASVDPPAGTIDRDATGAPTGVMKEGARDLMVSFIPEPSSADRRAGILASVRLMNREGMTAAKDPNIYPADWDAYSSLAAEGLLTAHVCTLWNTGTTLVSAEAMIARLASLPGPRSHPAGADLVSCGVKLFMDGSGGARTAWVYDDWNRQSVSLDRGNHGYPLIEPDVYRAVVRLFNDAGIHIGTHAIGDRAIDWVVDSYAEALTAHPGLGLRHSIIHANIPTDGAIATMARLQRQFDAGYPEAQAPFSWWIGDTYAANFGPARAARLNPFRTYLERGVRWAGGSDYDVTPLPARFGLWASIARETLQGTWGRQPFGSRESVDVHAALRSYTVWAARQLFIEDEAGSLERGKSADVAVWDRNPYTVPTAELKDLQCELTLYRGRIVHRAEHSALRIRAGAVRASGSAASGT